MVNQLVAVLAVAVGGAVGSVVRFLVGTWFLQKTGPAFPWGTLVINVSGAFLIGVVLQFTQTRYGLNPYVRLFAATGILGGYTTFSTYAYETLSLMRLSEFAQGALYAFCSVIAGVGAAYLGTLFTKAL